MPQNKIISRDDDHHELHHTRHSASTAGRTRITKHKMPGMWHIVAVLLLATTMMIALSCRERRITQQERHTVDSLVRRVNGIDSLKDMYRDFKNKGNALGCVTVLRELGKIERNENNFDEAIKYHSRSLTEAEAIKDTLEIVQALNNIGTDYRRLSVLETATQYHYRAWKLCEECSDTSYTAKKNLVVSLNGLGNIYLTTNNFERAEEVLRKALDGEKRLKSSLGQAINYANLGSIFEHRARYDSAWAYYRKSMELNKKAGSTLGMSLCHANFGSLYEKEGNYDSAVREYEKAYQLMESSKDEWHVLNSLIHISKIYVRTGHDNLATEQLNKARDIAIRIRSREHLAEIYDLYYKINEKRSNWYEALNNYVKACHMKDSVVDMKKLNQIQNLSISIEQARQKRLTEEARQKYKTERFYRILAYAVLGIILLIFAGTLILTHYYISIRKRKHKMTKEMNQMREKFFINITHELRTPLTVILGLNHDMAKHADSPDKISEMSRTIDRHGNNLLQLINQLLDIAKIKSQQGEANWKHGDINAYVDMIVEGYRSYAREKGIEMRHLFSGTADMDFVPDYINKILNNLLSNAIKFTPDGGKVEVRTFMKGSDMVMKVSDTGKGIPKEKHDSIFEPFIQAPGDTNQGTGVGLALVKSIVQAANGKIDLDSTLGKGTCFTITIPVKHGNETYERIQMTLPSKPVATHENDKAPDDSIVDDNRTRVLIIEDNNDVARYIGSQFTDSCDVCYAFNGRQGVKRTCDMMPDIIITDLMMPEMDGLEVCRQVRENELTCHIPIIMLTAKVSTEERVEGFKAGADAYIGKPFNGDELTARVEQLLEQRRQLRMKYSLAAQEDDNADDMLSAEDRHFIHKTVDAIYILLEKGNLNVTTLADKLCVSQRQFQRKLTAITGETPASFIANTKMKKAKQMLDKHPATSLDKVATMCGFELYSSFYHVFKKTYGISPKQYISAKSNDGTDSAPQDET